MTSTTIHPKPAPGFQELADAKTLLAYLKCGDLTLQYCKDELGITNPFETIALLRFVGKKAGFKIIYCCKTSTLKLTNTATESLRCRIVWMFKNHLLAWKCQFFQITTWIISKVENTFIGSNLPRASRIVDWCLFIKDQIGDQAIAPSYDTSRGEI